MKTESIVIGIAIMLLATARSHMADEPAEKSSESQSDAVGYLNLGRIFSSCEFDAKKFGPIRWLEDGSGFTTLELSRILALIIEEHTALKGLYHISSEPISKYDLLCLINRIFELNIEIEKDDGFVCDRSLDSSKFREETGYSPPPWEQMIRDMAQDLA